MVGVEVGGGGEVMENFQHSREWVCITASGNILGSGNFCFRVFKLQLKVINKNVCYLYNVGVNQIN